ncbi:unnamed protein product [Lathyrus oleraceus]
MEFIRKTVHNELKGLEIVLETMKYFDSSLSFLNILFDDGQYDKMRIFEVASLLKIQLELPKVEARVGWKPKKRQMLQRSCRATSYSCNVTDNLVAGNELNMNEWNLRVSLNGTSGSVGKIGNENWFGVD